MKEGEGRNSDSSSTSAPNSSAPASSLYGLTRPLLFPPLLCLSVSAFGSDLFLGLRAFCGLAFLFTPMKKVTETPPLPRGLPSQDGTPTSLLNPAPLFSPFPLCFLLALFYPSSVSLWRGAGPAAVADVDGEGCAGSVSTTACPGCMRVGVGEVSLSCFAGCCGVRGPVHFRFGRGGGVDGGGGSGRVAGTDVCFRSARFSSVSLSIRSLIVVIRTLRSFISCAVSFAAKNFDGC